MRVKLSGERLDQIRNSKYRCTYVRGGEIKKCRIKMVIFQLGMNLLDLQSNEEKCAFLTGKCFSL